MIKKAWEKDKRKDKKNFEGNNLEYLIHSFNIIDTEANR